MDFNRKHVIVGVGSALVDILAQGSDEFVARSGAVKGGMVYVDNAHIDQTLAKAASPPAIVPGGSACNTTVGVGQLGGAARFVGTCGQGAMGNFFENALRTRRVDPRLARSNTPTGRVLSIITPDAERSMLTFLGAASETRPEDLRADYFADADSGQVNGAVALRQPGSSIKPITYAAAFASGKLTPATMMLDVRTSFVTRTTLTAEPVAARRRMRASTGA